MYLKVTVKFTAMFDAHPSLRGQQVVSVVPPVQHCGLLAVVRDPHDSLTLLSCPQATVQEIEIVNAEVGPLYCKSAAQGKTSLYLSVQSAVHVVMEV